MAKASPPYTGILVASLASGPIIVIATLLALFYAELPKPVVISGHALGSFVAVALIAIPVGLLLGFLPNLIGATLMARAGAASETARLPLLWMLVGAAAGATAGFGFDAEPELVFALTATSAACALICRRFADWSE